MGGRLRIAAVLTGVVLLAPAAAHAVVGDGTTFADQTLAWAPPPAQVEAADAAATPFAAAAVGSVSVAADSAGNLYAAWSDGRHIWEASSLDDGATWSSPTRVDVGPGTTALPVILAGDPGRVAVAYYKTPYVDAGAPASSFPVDAVWWVALSESSGGHVFVENRASSSVQYGPAPTTPLSLSLDPATALVRITYPSELYDPQQAPPSQCDAAASNTDACLHTMLAVQTSGQRLVSPPPVRGVKAARKTIRRRRRR